MQKLQLLSAQLRFNVSLSFIVIFLNIQFCKAQSLHNSRQSSYYTYIYQLTDSEAEAIYSTENWKFEPNFFHTLIDSVPTDSVFSKKLPVGHYLKTLTRNHLQEIEILSQQDFHVFIFNNTTDLNVQVVDGKGGIIDKANVRIDARKLNFKKDIQCYSLTKSNQKGLLKIQYENKTVFYKLKRNRNNSWLNRTFVNTVWKTPLKYAWIPIRYTYNLPIDGVKSIVKKNSRGTIYTTKKFFVKLYEKTVCLFDKYECDDYYDFEHKFQTFYALNKPMFKPGDTVKFKAYIAKKNGKPLNKNVQLTLYNGKKYLKLAQLEPIRPGSFVYNLVLHDSLDLQLDRFYSFNLENKKEEEYLNIDFQYRDYELKNNQLELRLSSQKLYKQDSLDIFIKATDANDLFLKDAQVQILILPEMVSKYYEKQLFIPDTLYYEEKKLLTQEETKINIPNSIFQNLDLSAKVQVTLTTSDQEIIQKTESFVYNYEEKILNMTAENDSIAVTWKENGLRFNASGQIWGVDALDHKTKIYEGDLPVKIPLNPFYTYYETQSEKVKVGLPLKDTPDLLNCYSHRTKDQVEIKVSNPRNIPFYYDIFKQNTRLEKGYTHTLDFSNADSSDVDYYVFINYIWAGKVKSASYRISKQTNTLNIEVTQPQMVFPGQTTDIEVQVTDFNGQPVKNVDLTAFALTKKFNYQLPSIPEFSPKIYYKNQINSFNVETLTAQKLNNEVLNYQFWKTKAHLDSIPYYQFTFPENKLYKFEYALQDSITQFAPYVFKNGMQQKVHVIYVDNKPVYFDWNTNYNPYSFRISPGYHNIRMRTSQSEIFLDSMYFNKGKKMIFSLNDTLSLPKMQRYAMKNSLTDLEKTHLHRYVFPYRNNTLNQTVLLKNLDSYFWLNNINNKYNSINITGPVSGFVTYTVKDTYENSFLHEPNFEYDIQPKLMKMREKKDYPTHFFDLNVNLNWHDQALTPQFIEQYEQNQLDIKRQITPRYNNPSQTKAGNGVLVTSFVLDDIENSKTPLNIILTQPLDPLFFRIYNGSNQVFHDLKPGFYQMTVLFADQYYSKFEPIQVQPYGTNYYEFTIPDKLTKDDFSHKFNDLIEENLNNNVDYNKPQTEVMEYQNLYYDMHNYKTGTNLVQGIVQDEYGPLPGVSVLIKGTTIGTETDFDGHYSIFVSPGNVLVFSYVGMSSVEKSVYGSQVNHVMMSSDDSVLDEVVIVGYGTTTKKSYVGCASSVTSSYNMVSFLNGEVAGVSITEASGIPGSTQSIRIRGYESVNGEFEKKALVVINGVPYFGDLSDIDLSFITEIKIIQDASAAALYGSRAANGVIIINTGQKNLKNLLPPENPVFEEGFMEAALQQNSIRSRFSDEAYWQPNLTTDKFGKAKFSVTYPDDVTSWDAHFIAIDRKKTGVKSTQVKALKPVMAQLFTPRFLLKGDSTIAIGKSINYIPDSIQITRQMVFNDKQMFKKESFLKEILIDSLPFIAEKDSIKIKYFLSKNDGYRDGELRDIPVFPVGLEKTFGNFYTLDRDTIIHPEMNPAYGDAKLYLRADVLDVLNDELQSVKYYKFDCNEQMASKLKAFLAEQRIQMHLGAKFKHEAEVKKLIQKLIKNQNSFALWGWWNVSETTPWISLHVLEALLTAEQLNYKVNINKDIISQSLIWMFANTKDFDTQIRILKSVILMRAKADYEGFYKELEKHNLTEIVDQLQMLEIRQLMGKSTDVQIINNHLETTLFGNIFISKPQKKNNIFTNEIQNTLLAYRILQRDSVLRKSETETLRKMRNYFLEKRNTGKWLNTYESVQIIETILPDLLGKETHVKAPEVYLKGILDQKITEFPFEIELNPDASLELTKTGTSPVYMSISQNYWDSNPMPFSADFEIKTHFSNDVDFLEAGKEVTLIATVQVHKDAEYVMISIPIPAGCSYSDSNKKGYQEMHRESFKNETQIFCQTLKQGNYTYEVKLNPRYSGVYTLNPAQVELMYFPTFNANNELKKVRIQ